MRPRPRWLPGGRLRNPAASVTVESLEARRLLAGGPRILSITPTEVRNAAFDHVEVVFDRDIDPSTFSVADVAIGGADAVVATGVQALTPAQYRVAFPALTVRGGYQVTIG